MKITREDNIFIRWALRLACMFAPAMAGCGPGEARPVDISPEDTCAHCRMAVSDKRFACEIITEGGEALKFDDIGCLEEYLKNKPKEFLVAAIYYRDYLTNRWIADDGAVIVETGIRTPMGSGKVAFENSETATEFRDAHPPQSAPAKEE